jgi:hypothetical protein
MLVHAVIWRIPMTFFPFSEQYSANLIPSGQFVPKAPTSHAQALETLFKNFRFDFERVSNSIDSILTAQTRCVETSLYIQGIVDGDSAFLCTNLNRDSSLHITLCKHQWLLGSSDRCSITISHPTVDPSHAAIHYDNSLGFFITDQGSYAGTQISGKQLLAHQSRPLKDGDLIELGSLRIEFFSELCTGAAELN